MNIRSSMAAIGLLAFSGLAGAQEGMSKEEWIKLEAEKEFKQSTMARLKALEDKNKDPKTGKDKDAWWDIIKFSGDFRLRHETIDTDTTQVRHRSRIRTRLNMDAKVNDEVDFGFRLATNEGGDAVSTNQTLTSGFSKKAVFIDLAYVDYHPSKDLRFQGGKIPQPFVTVGRSDLIWDGDLTPEGIAAKYNAVIDALEFFFVGAIYSINEKSTALDDTRMFGAQVGIRTDLGGDMKLTAGASIFSYPDTKGELVFPTSSAPTTFGSGGSGNQTTGAAASLLYAKEFKELEFFLEIATTLMEKPFAVFADVVDNIATSGDDKAWLAGFAFGKLSNPGDWAVNYNYRKLQRNAMIGSFTDSDSGGGGTNHKGHKVSFETQIAKKWSGGITYFRDETGIAAGTDTDYHRFQFDLMFKF